MSKVPTSMILPPRQPAKGEASASVRSIEDRVPDLAPSPDQPSLQQERTASPLPPNVKALGGDREAEAAGSVRDLARRDLQDEGRARQGAVQQLRGAEFLDEVDREGQAAGTGHLRLLRANADLDSAAGG